MSTHTPPARDLADIVQMVAPEVPVGVAHELERILLSMEPSGSLAHRVDVLDALAAWIRGPGDFELPDRATVSGRSGAGRVWVLLEVLRVSDPWRSALARLTTGLLLDTSPLRLFARTGLPAELRLFNELGERILSRLLPRPPEHEDLSALVARLFPDEAALAWLEVTPPQLVADLVDMLLSAPEDGERARGRVIDEAIAAVAMLSVRVATLGLDEDIRTRSAVPEVRDSPFLELASVCATLAQRRGRPDDTIRADTLRADATRLCVGCRAVFRRAASRLDEGGVSVDLVFRVELLGRLIDRVEDLLEIVDEAPASATEHRARLVRFFRALVAQGIADRSLVALVQNSSRLLARRIVERAGETGEHYITASRDEWHAMVRSAAGGGLLTAGTCVVKFWIGWAHFPYFFQAVFYSLDYAASFLALQFLGFTLATKQPSMTAAALASTLDGNGRAGLSELVDQIARTARSQLAAVMGNLGAVIPAAVAFHLAWLAWTGAPFLDGETAYDTIASLHPLEGATLFYGAFTGVLLWASSMAGGWVENWFAFHRLPEAIEHHRALNRWLGKERARALARGCARHVSGVASNVALGLLLGATPIAGKFFGAPLDVRHVTLSTGALTLAGASVGPLAVTSEPFRAALGGIVLVGLLNFVVSFSLALGVALRARNVPLRELVALLWAVIARAARRPTTFLYPPAEEQGGH